MIEQLSTRRTALVVVAFLASITVSCVLGAQLPPAADETTTSGTPTTTIDTFTSTATSTTTTTTTTQSPSSDDESGTTVPAGEPVDDSQSFDFTSSQNTSTFTCDGKITGYYADVKLNCRVYHFCTQMDALDGPAYQRMSYLCLENSFFDQKDLNCVKESDMKVPCEKAEAEYVRSNKQFDAKEESPPSISENLATNIMMNPITRFIAGR